jgi:2,5-diamino-6-(ribosylamino)-4(3H)-pyrimidinone 5'-phosphate reductase
MNKRRPFVILNSAITADGKTDAVARQGATISSPQDKERVDRLRAECDAIMVGGRTLLGDDPRLTVKSERLRAARRARGLSENPIKVGVVTEANLKHDSRFLTMGPARVIIFTTWRTGTAQLEALHTRGAEVMRMGETRVDLPSALEYLWREGVRRLLVEGGGTLNAELLKLELVDEIYLYIAPLVVGGATAPTLVDGAGFSLADVIRLELRNVERLPDAGILANYSVIKKGREYGESPQTDSRDVRSGA